MRPVSPDKVVLVSEAWVNVVSKPAMMTLQNRRFESDGK